MYLIIGIIFIGIGLLMLLKPHIIFSITESWKSDLPGEPSDLYLLCTRLGGVFVFLVGAASMVVQFLV